VSDRSQTATFTTEFGQEFAAEHERWLRRRFLWYTGIIGGFNVLMTLIAPAAILVAEKQIGAAQVEPAIWIVLGVRLAIDGIFAWAFVRA
jgi:hypothetical protein